MGAEAIQELLQAIDLDKEYEELQEGLKGSTGQKRARIVKRLEVVGGIPGVRQQTGVDDPD